MGGTTPNQIDDLVALASHPLADRVQIEFQNDTEIAAEPDNQASQPDTPKSEQEVKLHYDYRDDSGSDAGTFYINNIAYH